MLEPTLVTKSGWSGLPEDCYPAGHGGHRDPHGYLCEVIYNAQSSQIQVSSDFNLSWEIPTFHFHFIDNESEASRSSCTKSSCKVNASTTWATLLFKSCHSTEVHCCYTVPVLLYSILVSGKEEIILLMRYFPVSGLPCDGNFHRESEQSEK